jgi:hypothetical protein
MHASTQCQVETILEDCRSRIKFDRKTFTRGILLEHLALGERSASQQRHLKSTQDRASSQPPALDDVLLSEFLFCDQNPAVNRQSRMLSTAHCSESSDESILGSARRNLEAMPFFALYEYHTQNAQLFEWTFGIKYDPNSESTHEVASSKLYNLMTPYQRGLVRLANHIDYALYQSAKSIFLERVRRCLTCTLPQ